MGCSLLDETRELHSISWPRPNALLTWDNPIVANMQIASVNGELAAVPWVRVVWKSGKTSYFNVSCLEEITFKADAPGPDPF